MIEINNLTPRKIDKILLKKFAKKVLKEEGKKNTSLSIALVGQAKIKELNRLYRKKNKVTDVLSFVYNNSFDKSSCGEIVISPSEVQKNARRYGQGFQKEFHRILIHGILHILGYDHERKKKEAEIMEKKEEYYLSKA